jgi:hypothetical protein
MPYEKQVQKLIGDGVNLLPPSDLIGESEAEKCVNFRYDQVGRLMGRGGTALLASGLGDWSHTIAVVDSATTRRYYLGVDALLYRYRGPFDTLQVQSGFDGDYLGWASYQGHLWVINKLKQGRVGGTVGETWYDWLPAPPTAAPGVAKVAGILSGAGKYYVTFATAKEYESNPTTVAGVITASAEISDLAAAFGVSLTGIQVSANPEVTKRHLYRIGGKLPGAYLVRTINDNTTTTATDNGGSAANDDEADPTKYFLTDAQAIDVGRLLEDDHDPPPAAFGLAGPYFDRLMAFNTTANPNRIWFTPSGEPWFFRGSASDDGDWVDVGEESDAIYAISPKPHLAIIYKQRSIWRLVGDFSDGIIERVTDKDGLKGPRGWASHSLVDYYHGHQGIKLMTGERSLKVSDKVDPIFKALHSGVVEVTKPMDVARLYYAVMTIQIDRLLFAYPEVT